MPDSAVDQRHLAEAYAERFDASRLEQLSGLSSEQLSRQHQLIGEGGHCRAWRIHEAAAAQTTRYGALGLVYKRTQADFHRGPGAALRGRQWQSAMDRLQAAGSLALVPPFHLAAVAAAAGGEARSGAVGMLMPFGPQPDSAAAAQWQPVKALILDLRTQLAQLGLDWVDIAQICCWQGIPFVYDWSDLRVR